MNEMTLREEAKTATSSKNYSPVATGFAMFSMFFGAGNSIFPLAIGQYAQNKNFYAILGMLITSVGVPFLGLLAMTLFNGNYKDFFKRTGVIPGFIVSLVILALIGPFGATPRCITLSFSTIQPYLPSLINLPVFSFLSCLVIYLLTAKKNRLLDILGYFLTPFLLGSLALIIFKGFWIGGTPPSSPHSNTAIFFHSLNEGYQTMDLMGAFFFSSIVIACLKTGVKGEAQENNSKILIPLALKASVLGAGLLSLVYFGFSYIASTHSHILEGVPKESLLGTVALHMLGPIGGIIACAAIALACLTTAIALVSVSADFLRKDCLDKKISYNVSLAIVLAITFLVSTLEFQGIAKILQPIVTICYPALIALSILNLAYKLYEFKPVKIPVLIVFLISLGSYLLG